MKKTTLGFLGAALAALAYGGWTLGHRDDARAAAKVAIQGPTAVSVVAPRHQDVPIIVLANGTVSPISSVELHPQVTSTIAAVHIREGQFVHAGQLLFTLDQRGARAGVDKAQAQVARDQAALADYERQYRRGQELLSKGFLAQGAVDTLHSQLDGARALLSADQAAARSAAVDASYTTIRAPMAGRVGAINVYPGSLVQQSGALTTVTQLDPINVSFTLPESALADLLAAQRNGAVPVSVTLDGQALAGTLSFIDNAVDPAAGVIRVKARFGNQDTRLWPGQYVSTRLTVRVLKNALVLPQNAIISNTRGTFVYTVDQDGSARASHVQRLYAFGASVAVAGLGGDERVVVEGKQNLRPGVKVKVIAAPAAGRGTAQ